ncbi:MAG: hypothetical protein ACT4P7_18500 [Gemmatimonadaceae bacterium]
MKTPTRYSENSRRQNQETMYEPYACGVDLLAQWPDREWEILYLNDGTSAEGLVCVDQIGYMHEAEKARCLHGAIMHGKVDSKPVADANGKRLMQRREVCT